MCIGKGFAFLLLLLIPASCTNIGQEINKDIANHAEAQGISPMNHSDDFTEEDTSFDISDIYGHWVIGDVAFRDITSVTKDGRSKPSWSERFVGSIIEYKENTIILENSTYEVELYRIELDYFYDLIKSLTMLDSVCLDFMEKYKLNRESTCFLYLLNRHSTLLSFPTLVELLSYSIKTIFYFGQMTVFMTASKLILIILIHLNCRPRLN